MLENRSSLKLYGLKVVESGYLGEHDFDGRDPDQAEAVSSLLSKRVVTRRYCLMRPKNLSAALRSR